MLTLMLKAGPIDTVADGFPVTDEMFGPDINGREIVSGGITSVDKVWFSNDTLKQSLVIELYKDNLRTESFLFYSGDIPEGMLRKMAFPKVGLAELAGMAQKRSYFEGFIQQARQIRANYFVTNKGFRLGMGEEEVTKVYGRPGKISKERGMQVWQWRFADHEATMFFQAGRLVGLMLHNDVR